MASSVKANKCGISVGARCVSFGDDKVLIVLVALSAIYSIRSMGNLSRNDFVNMLEGLDTCIPSPHTAKANVLISIFAIGCSISGSRDLVV